MIARVIDEDGIFRARVAEAADESEVGRASWLWLHRPVGWLDDPALAPGSAPDPAGERTDGAPPRWPTFGVTLLPTLPADNEQVIPALRPVHLFGGPTLLEQVITTTLVGRDQAYLDQPWVSARTIRIDTADIGVLDFGLSTQQKSALYDDGARAGRAFLTTWNWSEYLARFR